MPNVRPYVFASFDLPDVTGYGAAVAVLEPGAPAAAPTPEVELPDVEAIKAAAWAEGFEQGQREGFQQGRAEGLRQTQEEAKASTRRLAELALHTQIETSEYLRKLEPRIVELSLAIADKLVEREVKTDPSVIVGVVRAALAELGDVTGVAVRVHPEDYALVSEYWYSLPRQSLGEKTVLVADEAVERGGCVIQTESGEIDAQLSTKLAQLTTAFEAVLEGEPA